MTTTLLDPTQWDITIVSTETQVDDLSVDVPRISDDPRRWLDGIDHVQIEARREYAVVRLTRRDCSGAGDLHGCHFHFGSSQYRVLRVLERMDGGAIVRCQVRPIPSQP